MKTDNEKINLGIFGGSCLGKDIQMKNNIKKIADNINKDKYQVYFGGGNSGIMAMVPRIFAEREGDVLGINWVGFTKYGRQEFGKEILFDTFRDRQYNLLLKSNIFLCLPGGLGTVSELVEVLMNNASKFWKDKESSKKIIVYNYNNFYDPIKEMIKKQEENGFLHYPEKLSVVFLENCDDIIEILK
tara:strand:+ start:347 stop:907 length:561 start_codon:yes stop_codon:yes gene_type:complete